MINELLGILFKWQTLIGGILGGLVALTAALIVATVARRREEVISGKTAVSNLLAVIIDSEVLTRAANKENIAKEEYPLWLSEMLVNRHASLSSLFEASIARLMPVDDFLAAHLALFQRIYCEIEVMLGRLSKDLTHYHKQGKWLRPKEHILVDARLVTKNFDRVVEHASCAQLLITNLILRRSIARVWHKLRRCIWMDPKEKKCRKLLREGSS